MMSSEKRTGLKKAIVQEDVSSIRNLTQEHGVDDNLEFDPYYADVYENSKVSPCQYAAAIGKTQALKELLEAGYDANRVTASSSKSTLTLACYYYDIAVYGQRLVGSWCRC